MKKKTTKYLLTIIKEEKKNISLKHRNKDEAKEA